MRTTGLVFLLLLLAAGCRSPRPEIPTMNADSLREFLPTDGKLMVHYFHAGRRCATCELVESTARLIADGLPDSGVGFATHDLDTEESRQLAEALGVHGQTLLLLSRDGSKNITTDAFLLAQTRPEALADFLEYEILHFRPAP
ncbi:MAG: hypothetical protein R2751_15425 [Bacteroidales bacterium]